MIKVKIRTHDATKYLRLTVEGHAKAAEKGQDLICCSASMLAFTVAQMVHNMDERGMLNGKSCIKLDEGDTSIIIRCKDDESYAEAKHTFFIAETGYNLLAHNYPDNVEVKTVGRAVKP